MDKVTEYREKRQAVWKRMQPLVEKVGRGESLTAEERETYDRDDLILGQLKRAMEAVANYRESPEGVEVRGELNEPVPAGRAQEWLRKAQENGVRDSHGVPLSAQGTDFDMNAYWGAVVRKQLMGTGISFPGKRDAGAAEMRALGEDTAGSGQAITPQAWSAQYVDVLLPNTFMGAVGARTVMMDQETVNVPVFSSTVSPTWIAEAGSISLDANPAFTSLQLYAPGGVKDITQFSIELAQDAFVQGNLDGMLSQAVAKKMAVVVDTAALLGIASNTGVPGLNGESGFVKRHYTGDSGTTGKAPVDTTELGVAAELAKKANVTANAFVSNIGCQQAFQRIPLATYGKYFDDPSLISGMDWVTSENSALPYVETDPATASSVAQSGGSYTSLYCGPWNQFAMIGWRSELRTRVLTERYIDSGELALFSYCRFSIRYAHPETFSRTIGVIPV
jgi:HK97 family phage major capsid protein